VSRYKGGGGPRALPKKRCGRKQVRNHHLGKTKGLLHAALRVWELRNGHISYGMADRIRANI
jgi:hypothetical protein